MPKQRYGDFFSDDDDDYDDNDDNNGIDSYIENNHYKGNHYKNHNEDHYNKDPPTVILARLIGQFGLILRGEASDCAHFFLVRVIEKLKNTLDQKIPITNYRSTEC